MNINMKWFQSIKNNLLNLVHLEINGINI